MKTPSTTSLIAKSDGMGLVPALLANVQTRSITSLCFVLDSYREPNDMPGSFRWLEAVLRALSREAFQNVRRVVFELCAWWLGEPQAAMDAARGVAKYLAALWGPHRRPGLVFEVRRHDLEVKESHIQEMIAVSPRSTFMYTS